MGNHSFPFNESEVRAVLGRQIGELSVEVAALRSALGKSAQEVSNLQRRITDLLSELQGPAEEETAPTALL